MTTTMGHVFMEISPSPWTIPVLDAPPKTVSPSTATKYFVDAGRDILERGEWRRHGENEALARWADDGGA